MLFRSLIIWTEIAEFDKILRTDVGRTWADMHRNMKEVLFNVLQDIQSTLTGFVAESRKQGYKNAISAGKNISPQVFDMACHQGKELRKNLQSAVMMMTAGHYKDVPLTYSIFQPPTTKDTRKRDLPTDAGTASQPARSRNSATSTTPSTDRQASNSGRTSSTRTSATTTGTETAPSTASTSTAVSGTQPLPGKTLFKLSSEHTDMRRLPNPGPIFPHPTRTGQYAMMCNRSAYEDRTCPSPECPHYHFPTRLSTIPADIKTKLKNWVETQPHVTWSPLVSSWVGTSTPTAGN